MSATPNDPTSTDAVALIRCTDLLAHPTDDEIGKAARQFREDQGDVPSAFAFQAGARWAREMVALRHAKTERTDRPSSVT